MILLFFCNAILIYFAGEQEQQCFDPYYKWGMVLFHGCSEASENIVGVVLLETIFLKPCM